MGIFGRGLSKPTWCEQTQGPALPSQVSGIRLFAPAASDIRDGDVDREIAGTAVLQLNTNEISKLRSANKMEEETWILTTSFISMANG